MKTPHKHRDLIIAWADGAEIEYKSDLMGDCWSTLRSPTWVDHVKYRIKPEPKPDYVGYTEVRHGWASHRKPNHNLKVTFDGETGKLKAAEVL